MRLAQTVIVIVRSHQAMSLDDQQHITHSITRTGVQRRHRHAPHSLKSALLTNAHSYKYRVALQKKHTHPHLELSQCSAEILTFPIVVFCMASCGPSPSPSLASPQLVCTSQTRISVSTVSRKPSFIRDPSLTLTLTLTSTLLDKIVVELLVTSILTILWVPLTLLFHRTARGVNNNHNNTAGTTTHSRIGSRGHYGGLHHESSGNFVLWVMWLVGAAIAVHQFPNRLAAGPGKEGRILITIIALAFVEFGLMTLAKVLALMEYAALGATSRGFVGTGPGHTNAMSGKTGGNYTGPATTV